MLRVDKGVGLRTAGAVFAMLFLVPWSAHAGTVTLTDWTAPGHFAQNAPNGGGAFLATTHGGPLGSESFLTFCLEFNERITLGNTFDYELSDSAMFGGVGGGPAGDPVSDATKWLYYQTVAGGGYDELITQVANGLGWDVGTALLNSGSYLQRAFWYLEQERDSGQAGTFAVKLAQLAVSGAAHPTTGWGALNSLGHNVFAMNLVNRNGAMKQDQLAYLFIPPVPHVPVPDGDPSTLAQLTAVFSLVAIGGVAANVGRRMRRRTFP